MFAQPFLWGWYWTKQTWLNKRVFGKQCKLRSHAAECGVRSGFPLFTNNLASFFYKYLNRIVWHTENWNLTLPIHRVGTFIQFNDNDNRYQEMFWCAKQNRYLSRVRPTKAPITLRSSEKKEKLFQVKVISFGNISMHCKGLGDFLPFFSAFLRHLLWFLVCISVHQVPSEKGSTLRGTKLIPWRANYFLLMYTPFSDASQSKFWHPWLP